MNDTNDIRRAMEVFDRVCDLPPGERAAALDEYCDGDAKLRRHVEGMLASEEDDHAILAESKHGAGAKIISEQITADTSASSIPDRIDRYKVIREIGHGGMGVVYEAQQDSPKRRVALKLIHSAAMSPSLIKRFEREAFALGQLQHPGIAHIYESGAADLNGRRQPFLAMELIEGERITSFAKENALDIRARLELTARVCDAVQHAHQKGVIHRDLKPANILVTEQSTRSGTRSSGSSSNISIAENGQPKILDFGVARLTDSDVHAATLQTDPGQIVGTLAYMSPEQVAGDPQGVDTRCDVYALGVVLFQLLVDRLPLDLSGKTVAEAARIIRDEEPETLSTIDRSLRGDVETIVSKALEKEPERRYASAAELAADIRRFLRDEPITARPASAIYNIRKFARRNKGLAAGMAATFITLIAGLASTGYYLLEARAQRDNAIAARDQADRQREIVETQRDDLQAVQAWYGELISEVDIEEIGQRLMQDLRGRVRKGLEDAKLPEEQIESTLETFIDVTRWANATDVAVDSLDLALFERAEQSIEQQFEGQPAIRASLLTTVGKAYNELTRGERALTVLGKAEAALADVVEPDPQTVGDILIERAEACADLGRDADAVPILRAYLAHCREHFGEDEAKTLRAGAYLASRLNEVGEREEAGELLADMLALHAARYGEEDSASLSLKQVLIWIELGRGNEEEVVRLGEEIIAARRRLDGPDHPRTLTALSEVGQVLSNIGRVNESLSLIREAYESSERVLGSDHAATIRRRHRLASKLSSLGKYEEAVELMGRVLEYQLKIHGPKAWATQKVQRGIAQIHYRNREYSQALALYEECLPAAQREAGVDHEDTLSVMSETGMCLNQLGRFAEAEAILREVQALCVAKKGPDDRDAIKTATTIAGVVIAQGRLEEGVELLTTELARSRRLFGDESIRTIIVARDLMFTLHDLGRYLEAEPLCREFLAFARKVENRPATGEALIELGSIELGLGENEAALETLDEAASVTSGATGATIERLKLLRGAALAANGRFDEAEPIMLAAYESIRSIQERIKIQRRQYILRDCAAHISAMYEHWEKPEAARTWESQLGVN
ncbi:MAG TPA: serine/threonine-protein kinase [Phycisphaerae bacterium]|nr:serine/threonine-protein kinase [Phycisphaerae bacterium]